MSYLFDPKVTERRRRLTAGRKEHLVLELQRRLMADMLQPAFARSLLDIGCGTGESLVPFLNKGIDLTGIDPCVHMLGEARRNLGNRVELYKGYAEDLPFDDNSFNYTVIFLTLGFCEEPFRAVEEACRVTRDRIFIGIINKFSLYAVQCRAVRLLKPHTGTQPRLFSIGEIRRMLFCLLGRVPLKWQTVFQVPWLPHPLIQSMESTGIFRSSPFGGFAGMTADPVPSFRAQPLALKCRIHQPAPRGEQVASCAGDYRDEKLEN